MLVIVSTVCVLFPNWILQEKDLIGRKGFPESYDVRRLLQFMANLKAGQPDVAAPVYSHQIYDIIPGQSQVVRGRPDIVIVEGLNVLQTGDGHRSPPRTFVSDFFDFSIYVDADEEDIRQWYVDRFHTFRKTVFMDSSSYFHRYSALSDEEATATALRIWQEINGVNL